MSKHNKPKKYFVHRLVAETFISNLEDKPQVNHIDGNPQNNNSINLEWVTNAENTQHAYDTKLNKKQQLPIEFKGEVKSLRKWCKELNLDYKKVWWRVHNGWNIERALNHIN